MVRYLIALLCLLALPAFAAAQEAEVTFEESPLVIVTQDGLKHDFVVELAETQDQRTRGLMFREELAPDRGMLFDFKRVQRVSMWMRNTVIPLDMLFIRADGRIATIAENTVPFSLQPIPSRRRVLGVLELPGGSVERLGIQTGDLVQHSIFERG